MIWNKLSGKCQQHPKRQYFHGANEPHLIISARTLFAFESCAVSPFHFTCSIVLLEETNDTRGKYNVCMMAVLE